MDYLPEHIESAQVFMTIKTYPNLSQKYGELVCTAGVCNGKLIRIYPIQFRDLSEYQQFKKFQWIEVSLQKRDKGKDFRLESYSPVGEIKLLEHISTQRGGWSARMKELSSLIMHDNMQELIEISKQPPFPSLAILKPREIIGFKIESCSREWTEAQKAHFMQPDFFKDIAPLTLKKLPYKYSYQFITNDNQERTLMIEDWEIGALYWNCLNDSDGNEAVANQKVKEKYMSIAVNPNTFFFVGTTLAHHRISPNPYIIIGVAYPPPSFNANIIQPDLF
ncbi:MAG: hypothetical protein WCV67_07575 [Victivallaceae bacterium]|jgi:hypothetical protein